MAPRPVAPPDVDRSIRIRGARAAFAAAIGAAMLENVTAGVAPRWWRRAPVGSFDRWDALDHLEGLLHYCSHTPDAAIRELREQLKEAVAYLPPAVIMAGYQLAATVDDKGTK